MSKPDRDHRSEAAWRAALTPEQFRLLREDGTEPPGQSPLNHERRPGHYHCAGCGARLFLSTMKYDSRSGWPSFHGAVDKALATRTDHSHGMTRTEVRCARCEGHLGHVFPDGPPPSGLRYCMNGGALQFTPE